MLEGKAVDDRTLARLRTMVERWSKDERVAIASLLRTSLDHAGRTPPHNADAEEAVISSVLLDGSRVVERLLPVLPNGEAFYVDAHRRIYDVAVELHASGGVVDITTVAESLKLRDRLQAVGGLTYLTKIVDATPSVANVVAHAKIVVEKARVRMLIDTCMLVAASAYGNYGRAELFIADAAEKVAELVDVSQGSRIQSIGEIGRARDVEIAEQWEGKRDPWGMRGPHPRLHALMHGYGPSEQTYVAGDTGSGKSAFANQAALYLAGRTYAHEQIGCAYVSLEMASKNHYDRAILHVAHELCSERQIQLITMYELMSGRVDGSTTERLDYAKIAIIEEARRLVQAKPIFFDDSDHDLVKLRTTLREMQRRSRDRGARLRFVVLDHMHIMTFPDEDTEAAALALMVKGFNDIAKDLEVHLMVLAQFGVKTESREVPVLNDIRGAAAIRQIAHKAILLHRPWTRMTLKQKADASDEEKRKAMAILAKHRNGREGVVSMDYVGSAFGFYERSEYEEEAA